MLTISDDQTSIYFAFRWSIGMQSPFTLQERLDCHRSSNTRLYLLSYFLGHCGDRHHHRTQHTLYPRLDTRISTSETAFYHPVLASSDDQTSTLLSDELGMSSVIHASRTPRLLSMRVIHSTTLCCCEPSGRWLWTNTSIIGNHVPAPFWRPHLSKIQIVPSSELKVVAKGTCPLPIFPSIKWWDTPRLSWLCRGKSRGREGELTYIASCQYSIVPQCNVKKLKGEGN